MLLPGKGKYNMVFAKMSDQMGKKPQNPGGNLISTAGFQEDLLRIWCQASGIGEMVKLCRCFFQLDHSGRVICGIFFKRCPVILYPVFLLLRRKGITVVYEIQHLLLVRIEIKHIGNWGWHCIAHIWIVLPVRECVIQIMVQGLCKLDF